HTKECELSLLWPASQLARYPERQRLAPAARGGAATRAQLLTVSRTICFTTSEPFRHVRHCADNRRHRSAVGQRLSGHRPKPGAEVDRPVVATQRRDEKSRAG